MESEVEADVADREDAAALVEELRRSGIQLWVEQGNLRFRAPAGAMTPRWTERLKAHKTELLRRLDGMSIKEGCPPSDQAHYPVSHAQRRLWFLSQLEAASAAYNVPFRLVLEGQVEADQLQQALRRLENRHEALRTSIAALNDEPRQVIAPPGGRPLRLRVLDFAHEADPEARTRDFMEADAGEPFDIEHGPLWRATLLRLKPARHVLSLTIHHLVCDGWSLRVMMRDLTELYENRPLAPLPIQYRDYAVWQNQELASAEGRARRGYWLAKLGGTLPVLDLPRDFPRPGSQSFKGGVVGVRFEAEDARRLAAFARAHQCSVFTVLLALIKVLLLRHTGQRDMIVGTAVAGRSRAELEGQVGCYINPLPLRSRLEPTAPFEDALRAVRRTLMEALDHQDYPFDLIIDALKQPRDFSRHPLFDVMVVSQTSAALSPDLGALRCSHLPQAVRGSKFDLTFDCEEGQDFIHIGIEYATDLFTPARIARLGQHLQTLLRDALTHPGKPVGRLDLLPAGERRAAIRRHEGPAGPVPENAVARIARAVRCFPERVAITSEGESWTYAQLWERAGAIAVALRHRGLQAGEVAAVLVERSGNLVAALLGVWRAGGAYLPLDALYPPERLALMLEDSGARFVVCDAASQPSLPSGGKRVVVGLDTPLPPAEELPPPTREDLAYLIYTSGSTGRPKGVQISHAALANFLAGMEHAPGLGQTDSLLAVTTVCFDIAALELFLPLCVGGRVVLASRSEAADGEALLGLIEREEVTVLQATPATWRALLAAGWEGSPKLRALCGGEALTTDLARQILARTRETWNLYGPTETTVWSAARPVSVPPGGQLFPAVPVGGPILGTQLYCLDGALGLTPLEVPGELYIAGHGLAWGYRGRPDLTAERFLPDPFATAPGARMYRTGDLVRATADGTFDFLGRGDQQVKIRGFRIEPGDIEAALSTHPEVAQVAVAPFADATGEWALAAYLVSRNRVLPTGMREFLSERLPSYMLPAAFVVLPRLPLTPNGKLDRRALPAPSVDGEAAGRPTLNRVEPRTSTERRLAALWSTVLGVADPGVQENFFELGGHSLRAVKLIAAIKREFGVALSLRDFFERPTIAASAESLDACAPPAPSAFVRPRIGKAAPLVLAGRDEPAGLNVSPSLSR